MDRNIFIIHSFQFVCILHVYFKVWKQGGQYYRPMTPWNATSSNFLHLALKAKTTKSTKQRIVTSHGPLFWWLFKSVTWCRQLSNTRTSTRLKYNLSSTHYTLSQKILILHIVYGSVIKKLKRLLRQALAQSSKQHFLKHFKTTKMTIVISHSITQNTIAVTLNTSSTAALTPKSHWAY